MPRPSDPSPQSRRDVLKLMGAGAAALAVAGPRAAAQDASTPPDLQGAGFYRFGVGDFELGLVSDGVLALPPQMFATNAAKEEVEAELHRRFLTPDPVPLHVNALVIRTGDETVLVDTGCGNAFGPAGGHVAANLARFGVARGDVTKVVLTHLHSDHFGGLLDDAGRLVFPAAEVVMTKTERDFWAGTPDLSKTGIPEEMRQGFAERAKQTLKGIGDRLRLAEPDAKIAGGIELVDAAGHTPGHVGLLVHSGDDALLYVTDAVHFAPLQLAHPGWHVAFDVDPVAAAKTRRAILDRAVADRALVAGSHLPFPALGSLRRRDGGFEWEPSIWRW